jgi:glycosyltransferase involved in cell wall biosynthesis
MLKGLAQQGYAVRCLAVSARPSWNAGAEEALTPLGVSVRFFAPGRNGSWLSKKISTVREPFSYSLSDELRRAVDQETRGGYDVLQLEQLWSGYLALGRERTLTSVHYLQALDLHDEWQLSPPFLLSKLLTGLAERRLLRRLPAVRTLTSRLEGAVRGINPRLMTYTVPISLDASLYELQEERADSAPVIGFVGSMHWYPGYLAAVRLITRIFPKVRAARPDARLLLAGWNARHVLRDYVALPGVEIVGDVPDAELYFKRLRVLAYPVPRGSGMMVKVLEALAYGVPVVTTSEGMEGIAAVNGVSALIADDDDTLVDAIVELLGNRDLRCSVRRNGRSLVERQYSPAATAHALEAVYQQLS